MGSSSCRNIYSFASSFFFFSLFLSLSAHAQSTLRSSQSIIDGDTLISSNEIFELGFFSPGSSKNRYVGIWYYNISAKSVVWIANRDNPLTNSSGVFSIESNGNLIISDGRRNVFWSTNTTSNSSVSAVLENTGNLVLSTDSIDNSSRVLWQSFDNPTDTFLPSMQIGLNLRTGHRDIFTSWKSLEDPSPGNVTIGIDPLGSAQIFMWRDSKPVWRSGDWNGGGFTGVPDMVPLYFYGFSFTNSGEEGSRYFTYSVYNNSRVRFVPSPEGIVEQFSWNEESGVWDVIWYQPSNECEIYGKCGPFGICNVLDSPICSCLEGFEPRNGEEWKMENWSGGCVRRTELGCGGNSSSGGRDGFLRIGEVKSPDKSYWRVGVDEEDCEVFCLNNCTCWAYAYVSGIGCMHWGGDLVDIQLFSGLGRNDLFVRLASSELGGKSKISKGGKSKISKSVIIIVVIVGVIFSATGIYILCRFKAKFKGT
eukprot:TRINITY_DN7388_c0_g1_i1.p1 TRINITY_DN7388_c0_g1~~TRINITY_DN7388_c0_g1_i1.p1  ORF type:complete len:479 (+),score=50.48 TRINITY_DN7388_c0_g1_i1:55-1491(+)